MRFMRWAGRIWLGILIAVLLLIGLLGLLRILLPLPFWSSAPILVSSVPADSATSVSPRVQVALRFSVAMNPRSVERALQIDPPITSALQWSDGYTTLTISPTQSLRPDTVYQVSLAEQAASRLFRPLAGPVSLRFHTASAPAVLLQLPADGARDVDPRLPLSIRFSRAIVPSDTLGLAAHWPQLRFDPPLPGQAIWLDAATVLFQPDSPLQPSTHYQATLSAELTALDGGELGHDLVWGFDTRAPNILASAPSASDRWVAPRAPLALRLAPPLDPALVQSSLAITPTVDGSLTTVTLPDATQWITFTPATDWQPGGSYSAVLRASPSPTSTGELARWNFTAAPTPALIGRFPGEGQALPSGQEVRLIFTTPIDAAALKSGLRLEPAADGLSVRTSDGEAHISADWRASTSYTLTLSAELRDLNGVAFARGYQIRFVTEPTGSALTLPDAPAHMIQQLPEQPASVRIRHANVSALNIDLYSLDEATTVRALAFDEIDWRNFQPERYAQPLLRSWSVPISATLNSSAEQRVPIAQAEGQALAPGIYYARIRTPEGPRADLLIEVSRVRLLLQSAPAGVQIWATDLISATPIGGLPVVLYQDGALIESGATDADGLWRAAAQRAGATPRYVALASGAMPALVSSAWSSESSDPAPNAYRVWLTTDRQRYRPGDQVELAGVVRYLRSQAIELPPDDIQAQLSVRQRGKVDALYRQTIEVSQTGILSTSFALPADTPPGEYVVGAAVSGGIFYSTITVQADEAPPLDLALALPTAVYAGEPATAKISVRTPDGMPVPSAALSWTLTVERMPFVAAEGYQFSDDEQPLTLPAPLLGSGASDAGGAFTLPISKTLAAGWPLRYRLDVRAAEPGGPAATATGTFTSMPAPIAIGVRLPSRVLVAGQAGTVEALALTPDGQPAPRSALVLTVYRRSWVAAQAQGADGQSRTVLRPRDERILTRAATSGSDGTASIPLALSTGGEYRVQISGGAASTGQMISAATLWVAAPGFAGWRDDPPQRARLVADREQYRAGDTATLLIATPQRDGLALITRARAGGTVSELQSMRAGMPLTLTLAPEDVPSVRVTVAQISPQAETVLLASSTLIVREHELPIALAVAADRSSYAPGATATLTLTTTDASGAPVPADLLLDIIGAGAAPHSSDISGIFAPATAPLASVQPPTAAAAPSVATTVLLPLAEAIPQPGAQIFWNAGLHTGPSGVLTLTVRLPEQATDLRVLAWALSGARGFAQAQHSLAVTMPLQMQALAPAFVREGDSFSPAALIRNSMATVETARLELNASGLQISAAPGRDIAVAPLGLIRSQWTMSATARGQARLRFSMRLADGSAQTQLVELPIIAPPTQVLSSTELGLLREYVDPVTMRALDPAQLRDGQLLRVRLTLVNGALRQQLRLHDPLPAGLSFVTATDGSTIERTNALVTFHIDTLAPGVYQYSYLARAATPGSYGAPAPTVQIETGAPIGAGRATRVTISAP